MVGASRALFFFYLDRFGSLSLSMNCPTPTLTYATVRLLNTRCTLAEVLMGDNTKWIDGRDGQRGNR